MLMRLLLRSLSSRPRPNGRSCGSSRASRGYPAQSPSDAADAAQYSGPWPFDPSDSQSCCDPVLLVIDSWLGSLKLGRSTSTARAGTPTTWRATTLTRTSALTGPSPLFAAWRRRDRRGGRGRLHAQRQGDAAALRLDLRLANPLQRVE